MTRPHGSLQIQEHGNGLVLPDGVAGREVGQMEAVALPGRLDDLQLPRPPARPEPLAVRAAAVTEHVLLREAHEHAPARQRAQRRRAAHERVDPGVVEAAGPRGHDAPHPHQVVGHGGVALLGGHLGVAQEVGVDQDDAVDPGAPGEPLGPGAHGHVVRDVGARALAGEGQPGEVRVVGEPGLLAGAGAVGGDPAERPPRVLVRGGEGVLGREAVLHGDDDGPGARREGVEVPVDDGVEGAEEAETAAVEVDQDGEPASTIPGCRREVEADGDVGGDGVVFGRDAGAGVGGGREGVGAAVALDAPAPENADAVRDLEDDLVVRGTGGGHGWLEVRFPLVSRPVVHLGWVRWGARRRRKASTDERY
jgi:hypothetical protein